MSGKTKAGKKTGLAEWAQTAKVYKGGGTCGTCAWFIRHPELSEEFNTVHKQIQNGELSLPISAVVRKLIADHGYPYAVQTFAGHLRRGCTPDQMPMEHAHV